MAVVRVRLVFVATRANLRCCVWLQYRVELRFGDVVLSKPTHNEAGSEKAEDLFPNAARLRNLT